MSQPIADIFMFEYWLNLAVSSLLISGGLNKPLKQGDADVISAPTTGIKSVFNGWWGGNSNAPHEVIIAGVRYPDVTQCKLFLKVQTARGDNAQDHARVVGTVRSLLLTGTSSINGKLPWHTLVSITEGPSVPDHQQDQNYDVQTLSFDARLRILYLEKTAAIFPT